MASVEPVESGGQGEAGSLETGLDRPVWGALAHRLGTRQAQASRKDSSYDFTEI